MVLAQHADEALVVERTRTHLHRRVLDREHGEIHFARLELLTDGGEVHRADREPARGRVRLEVVDQLRQDRELDVVRRGDAEGLARGARIEVRVGAH